MWMVYNEFGEELCGAENERQAELIARLYNGTYRSLQWNLQICSRPVEHLKKFKKGLDKSQAL